MMCSGSPRRTLVLSSAELFADFLVDFIDGYRFDVVFWILRSYFKTPAVGLHGRDTIGPLIRSKTRWIDLAEQHHERFSQGSRNVARAGVIADDQSGVSH